MSTDPLHNAVAAVRIATIPDTQMEPRRSLGILIVASKLLVVVLLADLLSVDGPDKTIWGPVEHVRMELIARVADSGLGASIVDAGDTFAKHIRLYFTCCRSEIASTPLPVDLIQAVGHQHSTGDDTRAFRSFSNDLDPAEKEIETRPYVRSVKTFSECEICAIGPVLDSSLVCKCPIRRLLSLFGKIDGVFFRR